MSDIPVSAVLLLPFPHQALNAAVGHWTTENVCLTVTNYSQLH